MGVLLQWAFGRVKRFEVKGASMSPVLREGDWVFVRPVLPEQNAFSPGDILVARHPHQKNSMLIKRFTHRTEYGLFLQGDNPGQSTDSRTLGAFPENRIVGKVTGSWSINKLS